MSIFRVTKDKNNPYVMVNKEWINNEYLSWKAKGILLYLLSKPDDWQVYEEEIVKHSRDGLDAVKTGIKELINKGYIKRSRQRDENGRLRAYEYLVFEHPTYRGFSYVGKATATNNEVTDINNGPASRTIDFCTFIKQREPDPDVEAGVKYFLNCYEDKQGRPHPQLRPEQWQYVLDSIMDCYDPATDRIFKPTLSEVKQMIDRFFSSGLKTDYNILHFCSPGIKSE